MPALREKVDQAVWDARFVRRWRFRPPPRATALQSYWHMLEVIDDERLYDLGDVVEIGVFLGGGTYQFAQLLQRRAPHRRVFAIDVFDPDFDATQASDAREMRAIYAEFLAGRDQRTTYEAVAGRLPNVETIAGDSAEIACPTGEVGFAHIDGNHSAQYVRGDFELLWPAVPPGGVVAFDDYGHDLPPVRDTVDALRAEREDEIGRFWTAGPKTAFVQRRR